MELQFTDFENSAFCAFVILLTQSIRQFNLNFLMPLSKVDENMQRAQKMNACLNEKFYFRKNIEQNETTATTTTEVDADNCELVEMTLKEIMNGTDEFKGLLPLVDDYLTGVMETLDAYTNCKIQQYLKLLQLRASGSLMTPAAYIRSFVTAHPDYKHDSVVSEQINYDLLWRVHLIAKDQIDCPELLFKSKC